MAARFAWVTMVMKGDSYTPGALVTGYSMKRFQNPEATIDMVCMVTPDVTEEARKRMKMVFDHVIEVPYLSFNCRGLKTQKQQNMYENWVEAAFTKWNCLSLVQYEKVCFIDADKIFLTNIDEIFTLSAPAATFSSPWSDPFVARSSKASNSSSSRNKGMNNPYYNARLEHGDKVPEKCISEGLDGSFVSIGTMVLLAPSITDYEGYKKFVSENQPFGYNSFSMMDEQSLSKFYASQWTYIHQRYNYIPWQRHWLDEDDAPKVFHYFGKKVWILSRAERWPDVEVWWQLVRSLLLETKSTSLEGAFDSDLLRISYELTSVATKIPPAALDSTTYDTNVDYAAPLKEVPAPNLCCWCMTNANYSQQGYLAENSRNYVKPESLANHNFSDDSGIVCPVLLRNESFKKKYTAHDWKIPKMIKSNDQPSTNRSLSPKRDSKTSNRSRSRDRYRRSRSRSNDRRRHQRSRSRDREYRRRN